MSVPPVPPPLDQIQSRAFSFYPAILGIEHNQWAFRKATWSEMLVFNEQANLEIWIPRRFIGEVSRIDEPVVIVGLTKELEHRAGIVSPHERRVLAMPLAVNEGPRSGVTPLPEPVAPTHGSSMKMDGGAESRVGRLILAAIAIGLVLCTIVVLFLSQGKRVSYTTVVQNDLGFTGTDDYWAVVNRLGKPAEDRWRPNTGELQYHLLGYPSQNLYVVLMGSDRKDVHYIGAFDRDWHVVHSINPDVGHMLHNLRKF